MPNEIRIHPLAGRLERGKPTIVPITVVLDGPLKVRGIHADFRGAIETRANYTTTTTDSKGRTKTETRTAVQHVEVTTQAFLISGNQRLGFLGNISDAVATIFGGGQHETMPAGKYPFEVEIAIPPDAPPTHVGKKSRIFYELNVQVDIPVAFDLKSMHSFQVLPLPIDDYGTMPIRTRYPDDAGLGLFDSLFTPDVEIEMALTADRYRLGETIDGIFCVATKEPLNCNAIRARLVGIESSRAHGHTDGYTHQGEAVELAAPGVISGNYKQQFRLPAQTDAPLTASGELFSIQWFVQIELDVPWAKDPAIRAPVTLLPQ